MNTQASHHMGRLYVLRKLLGVGIKVTNMENLNRVTQNRVTLEECNFPETELTLANFCLIPR